jgi:hypothetical protein
MAVAIREIERANRREQDIRDRVYVVWHKEAKGWHCSGRMTQDQAEAMRAELARRGKQCFISEKRPPSIEDLLEG